MTNTDLSVTTRTTDRQTAVPAPGRVAPATEARLAGIDRDATKHVQDNRPDKSRNGYAADWRAWEAFCAETNLPPLAVPVLTGQLGAVLPAVVDHEVYFGALRQLIAPARARAALVPGQAAEGT
ncbi:hypothetical protein [Streptomyces sp. HUAS TT3]|uniref:hypothetical protein n=1 Tax=Streptomyces sp. HUAS TT3 TaxID=3447510 RepID=UPI003F659617